MKAMIFLMLGASAGLISCDRHEFDGPEGTRRLNEPFGKHAEHAEGSGDPAEPAAEKDAEDSH